MNSPTNNTIKTMIGGNNQYHNPSSTELLKMFQ